MNTINKSTIKNIDWTNTPIMKGGVFQFKKQFDQVCGDTAFGYGRGKAKEGYVNTKSFMEHACGLDVFQGVPPGDILKAPPTEQECILKLRALNDRAYAYYSEIEQTRVTDHWSRDAGVKDGCAFDLNIPRQKRVYNRQGKRFSGVPLSTEEQVRDMIEDNSGMLSEGHVVAFLNSGLKCPECKVVGQIGWCDGITHKSVDAFRDAVCMNCRKNGVATLFEIKTRWEKHVAKERGTYAGSFVALNTLMAMKANVYLVIASRDTGDVRIGKITSAKMRGNRNWLYALQEGFTWGGPSSYVVCEKGLSLCPVKMPILIEIVTDDFCKRVADAVLGGV